MIVSTNDDSAVPHCFFHHDSFKLKGGVSMPASNRTFLKLLSTVSLAAPLVATGFSAPAADDDIQTVAISPKVVLISLDGAKPDFIQQLIADRVLPENGGLAKVSKGVVAIHNIT